MTRFKNRHSLALCLRGWETMLIWCVDNSARGEFLHSLAIGSVRGWVIVCGEMTRVVVEEMESMGLEGEVEKSLRTGHRSMIENRDCKNGVPYYYEDHLGEELVISDADVADELAFWKKAVISYVLGGTIQFYAMDGFVDKHLEHDPVDRASSFMREVISFLFLIALRINFVFWNRIWFLGAKPRVLRERSRISLWRRSRLHRIPTWVRFRGLDYGFGDEHA
ncbi:hypothetical protein Dimus_036482 [Dionaea muscipula]